MNGRLQEELVKRGMMLLIFFRVLGHHRMKKVTRKRMHKIATIERKPVSPRRILSGSQILLSFLTCEANISSHQISVLL